MNSPDWSITPGDDSQQDAQPLVEQPEQGRWDEWLHTPSYVYGPSAQSAVGRHDGGYMRERIYYAGSSGSGSSGGTDQRLFAIGVLERVGDRWLRREDPVLHGTTSAPCVFEPKVRFLHGKWRMWYLAAPKQAGPDESPDYRIEYVDSDDGINWSRPREVFSATDSYFDAAVTQRPAGVGYDMVVARGPDLFATPVFRTVVCGGWGRVAPPATARTGPQSP